MTTEHFGQLVIGPPGSGKSTYCTGMYDLLTSLGRDVRVINLDPACSPQLPYPCAIDIRSLITLQDVMDCYGLGPNGGIIYAMEHLATNIDWLRQQIAQLPSSAYLLFDFPGQVELYTCSAALDTLFQYLQSTSSHLTAVHLIDSYHLHSPSTFLSAALLSLSSMCRLSLPHVNVLSKIDACERMGELPLPLSAYTDGMELGYLMQHIRGEMQHDSKRAERQPADSRDGQQTQKGELTENTAGSSPQADGDTAASDSEEYVEFESGAVSDDEEDEGGSLTSGIEPRYLRLSELLCELVDSYSLVSFSTLAIHDKRSVLTLLRSIDTSNGYIFTNTDREYELAAAKQTQEQRQQQQQQYEQRHRQEVSNGQRQPTNTTTRGGYSMFNLVNTEDDSHTAALPQSAQTTAQQSLHSMRTSAPRSLRSSLVVLLQLLLCSLPLRKQQ